jgi:hypothetical protein
VAKGSRSSRAIELICRLIIAALCVALSPNLSDAKVAVTTYHYDNLQTGWNNSETNLTASKFPRRFGVVATVPLDDQVDAQPLFVPGLIINGATHDVVYVATESNSIYAIDASSGKILMSTKLGTPAPEQLGCTINGPNLGIMGTPVIDVNANLLFVVAYVKTSSGPAYQLHRLNLVTLQDTVPFITIAASHTLTDGSVYAFNAAYQRQRPGLLELNLPTGNVVYAGFGSFCDFDSQYSRDWILGWTASSLTPLSGNANQLNDTQTTATSLRTDIPTRRTRRCSCLRSGCRDSASPATELPFTSPPEIPTATGRSKAIRAPRARRGPARLIFKRASLGSRAALLCRAFSRRPRQTAQTLISWIKGTWILGPAASCSSRPAA